LVLDIKARHFTITCDASHILNRKRKDGGTQKTGAFRAGCHDIDTEDRSSDARDADLRAQTNSNDQRNDEQRNGDANRDFW